MMLFCLIATVGIFAGTVTVSDTESFTVDMDNYAVVSLSGSRDTSTDRLSNVIQLVDLVNIELTVQHILDIKVFIKDIEI